jgi:hypothetical protein
MSNPHHLHQQFLDSTREGSLRESRYPQGYLPKIMFWSEELYNACEYCDGIDTDRIKKAKAKLDYFYNKQNSL